MEMTYERAAEILDPDHREAYDSIEPVITACKMGMEALKKQIPTEPDEEDSDMDGWAACPSSNPRRASSTLRLCCRRPLSQERWNFVLAGAV